MQQPSKITEYLEAVGQQISWKRAQPLVLEEINNHITDQKDAFICDGFNEVEATDRALAEMGILSLSENSLIALTDLGRIGLCLS